jgi:hypothetical protein
MTSRGTNHRPVTRTPKESNAARRRRFEMEFALAWEERSTRVPRLGEMYHPWRRDSASSSEQAT